MPVRVVLLTKPYPLADVLEQRIAATGCLVGVMHETPPSGWPGLKREARRLVSRSGVVRALDVETPAGQAQIFWDGTDAYGDRVSNGAYLYLVQAVGSSSGAVVKTRGRAAVIN